MAMIEWLLLFVALFSECTNSTTSALPVLPPQRPLLPDITNNVPDEDLSSLLRSHLESLKNIEKHFVSIQSKVDLLKSSHSNETLGIAKTSSALAQKTLTALLHDLDDRVATLFGELRGLESRLAGHHQSGSDLDHLIEAVAGIKSILGKLPNIKKLDCEVTCLGHKFNDLDERLIAVREKMDEAVSVHMIDQVKGLVKYDSERIEHLELKHENTQKSRDTLVPLVESRKFESSMPLVSRTVSSLMHTDSTSSS